MTEGREMNSNGGKARLARNRVVWNVVMLFFSVYSIIGVAVVFLFPMSADVESILLKADHAVCAVFLVDFLLRLAVADSKLGYLRWGWLDLVSAIPAVESLRIARLVRIFRLIRILRGLKSAHNLIRQFSRNRSSSAFAFVSVLSFLTVLFGAILVLEAERNAGGNIQTGDDALWWAFATVTTCGYGDFFPVTGVGRLIAAILMVCGIGVFGTFAAYVASLFVKQTEEEDVSRDVEMMAAIKEVRTEVAALRAELQEVKGELRQADGRDYE